MTNTRAAQLLNPYDSSGPAPSGRGRGALSAGAAGLAAAGVLVGGGTMAWADEEPPPRAASADEVAPGTASELPQVVSDSGEVISPPDKNPVTLSDSKGNSFTFGTADGETEKKGDTSPAIKERPADESGQPGPVVRGDEGDPDPPAETKHGDEAKIKESAKGLAAPVALASGMLARPEWPNSSEPSSDLTPAPAPGEWPVAKDAQTKTEAEIAEVEKNKAARRYQINHNQKLTEEQSHRRLQHMREQAAKELKKIDDEAAGVGEDC